MKTTIRTLSVFLAGHIMLLAIAPVSLALTLQPLEESELRDVVAQGLILNDKITGTELTGANEYSTPFNFYRMGLDGELEMNMNMSKIQLGCGGINDYLTGQQGCDIDLDYVSLMGRNGSELGDPGSLFKLTRPYIEVAVKNDDTSTLREVAGIKIGAQKADGGMSIGRVYGQSGIVNQENMLHRSCDPSATTGSSVLGCHSGVNTVSGFLGTEMSLSMRVKATVCAGALIGEFCLGLPIGLDAWGCIGRTATENDTCGTAKSDALFIDIAGTRLNNLGLNAAQLKLNDAAIDGGLADLLGNAYASLDANTRLLHKITFEDTSDFFLAFQREPIAYPRYSKTTPTQEFIDNGTLATALDACAGTSYASARCDSAYSVPANTGWWMNAPSVKLNDVYNDNAQLGNLTLGDALSLLGAPGYKIEQANFKLEPAPNCYGSTTFC